MRWIVILLVVALVALPGCETMQAALTVDNVDQAGRLIGAATTAINDYQDAQADREAEDRAAELAEQAARLEQLIVLVNQAAELAATMPLGSPWDTGPPGDADDTGEAVETPAADP